MDVKNFYLLLELSTDPPEENPEVIAAAIRSKQAVWSKQRNHPTKGTRAQQYIGLIPKIQQVMTDPKLRRQEALKARKILQENEKNAYARIDRHIALFLSKGSITKKEIAKIARIQSLDEKKIKTRAQQLEPLFRINLKVDELVASGKTGEKDAAKLAGKLKLEKKKIQGWIQKKKEDRDRDIENYITRCLRRGYITAAEVSQLSLLYSIKEAELIKKIRCPVKKKKDGTEQKKPLERTIENLINDKLRIVGKSSLYDFLGLPREENLDELQKRARSKEAEIRRISHKDAETTAGGALVGHCMAVFKNEESRQSYDLSLTMSRISELNTDIDIAENKGRIRAEYMDILVKAAIRLGLDIEEARAYIEEYCKSKKWRIEKKGMNPRKKRMLIMLTAGILLPLIIGGGFFYGMQHMKEQRIRNAYESALKNAEKQAGPEGKEMILKNFVRYYPDSPYTADAEKKIREIQQQIRESDFAQSDEKARTLMAAGKEDAAMQVYLDYAGRYPGTLQAKAAEKQITEIKNAADDRDFQALKSLEKSNYEARIAAYNAYFDKYPDGRHTQEVRSLISEMVDAYFGDLKKNLSICEAGQDWEKCIALCRTFIAKFKNTEQADDAKGLLKKYENKVMIRSDLAEMKKKAEARGSDYEGARLIYLEYLEANPELPSYLKELIVGEIRVLDQKIKRLEQAEKEWEEVLAYSQSDTAETEARIRRMESFLQKYPDSGHQDQGRAILEDLKERKKAEDIRRLQEQEERAWRTLLKDAGNAQSSLTEKIRKTENFLAVYSSGKYGKNARALLLDLKKQKAAEEERLRNLRARQLRMQQEKQRIAALFRQSGGRFRDNGNGTVTDTRTGLMWTMFDSAFELGRCINFPDAQQYAADADTGGYSDWRLPTVNELGTLFKSSPRYPASSGAKWFWSSETFWHGWNKESHIVSVRGQKESVSVEKCGAVLAVRP